MSIHYQQIGIRGSLATSSNLCCNVLINCYRLLLPIRRCNKNRLGSAIRYLDFWVIRCYAISDKTKWYGKRLVHVYQSERVVFHDAMSRVESSWSTSYDRELNVATGAITTDLECV